MRLARWTTLCLVPFLMASLPARAADWALRFDGIGPLQIGMRFDAANAALDGSLRSTPVALRPTPACQQVPVAGHPGVALMFVDEVLERIDVFQAGVGSEGGVQVGAPIAAVRAAYPGLAVEANAYDEREHYLTVAGPASPHPLALRFETRQGAVGLMTAGRLKAVRYIEGCL